ncbi:hypothetical protein MMC12_006445 [Toensbergia leucococca]|nr:hypothetical protein [Toensbergia leucococca]
MCIYEEEVHSLCGCVANRRIISTCFDAISVDLSLDPANLATCVALFNDPSDPTHEDLRSNVDLFSHEDLIYFIHIIRTTIPGCPLTCQFFDRTTRRGCPGRAFCPNCFDKEVTRKWEEWIKLKDNFVGDETDSVHLHYQIIKDMTDFEKVHGLQCRRGPKCLERHPPFDPESVEDFIETMRRRMGVSI